MTLQQILDKVTAHLLTQNRRSLHRGIRGFGPAYRGIDGTMCAVGVLIHNDHYNPLLEGGAAQSIRMREALRLSGIDTNHDTLLFLSHLQAVHDNYDPENWEGYLREIAEEYGLQFNYQPPQEVT